MLFKIVSLILLYPIKWSLILLIPLGFGIRAIGCGLNRVLGCSTDIGEFLVDISHFIHVLLEIFLLILIDVPHLQFTDVILVLFDVSLSLRGIFIMPKVLFHIVTVALDLEMLKKLNKQTHHWPNCGCFVWTDDLLGPKIKHDLDCVEKYSEGLRYNHEGVSDPEGNHCPYETIDGIHQTHREVDCAHISGPDDFRHVHKGYRVAHDARHGSQHATHRRGYHVEVEHLAHKDHTEKLLD
jgi:hypothetical protein